MQKRDMINELLERLEAELDELSPGDLAVIMNEYEHSPLLSSLIDELSLGADENSEEDEETDEIQLDEWVDDEEE